MPRLWRAAPSLTTANSGEQRPKDYHFNKYIFIIFMVLDLVEVLTRPAPIPSLCSHPHARLLEAFVSEHRKQSRSSCALSVQLHAPSEDVLLFTYATNISPDGVYVRANRPLPVGAEVRLDLQPPAPSEAVRIAGVVVRVADGEREPRGIGVAFMREQPPEQEDALDRLLNRVDLKSMLSVGDAETFSQFRHQLASRVLAD